MKRVNFLIRSLISSPNLRHTSRIGSLCRLSGRLWRIRNHVGGLRCDALCCAVMDEVGRQAGDCKESF
jgi:hypothetical protein